MAIIVVSIIALAFLIIIGWDLGKARTRLKMPPLKRWHALAGLAVICAISLFIRGYLPLNQVFINGSVYFTETDAYFHMSAVDSLLAGEMSVLDALRNNNLLSLLIIGVSWLIGLGQPSALLVETTAAWMPVVLGTITLAVVYLLAAMLFNRLVGLMAAMFLNVIPSEFLHRSTLGFTDQHVLEVLLALTFLYFAIRTIKATGWFRYAVLAGVTLYLYLANWEGGIFLVFIVMIYWSIQITIALYQRNPCRDLSLRIGAMLSLAAIPFWFTGALKFYMMLAAVAPFGYLAMCYLYERRRSVFLVIASAGSVIGAYFLYIYWFDISYQITHFFSFRLDNTITETAPLFFPAGSVFSLNVVWASFQWLALLFCIGIGYFARRLIRNNDRELLVFLVWSLLILIVTFCMRRYLYYFSATVAIVSAVVIYQALSAMRKLKPHHGLALAVIVVALFTGSVAMPNYLIASAAPIRITPDWERTLEYIESEPAKPGKMVTAWSDYGWWIKYFTNQEPNYTPGAQPKKLARLMMTDANRVGDLLDGMNTEYIVLDSAMLINKVMAVIQIAEYNPDDFYGFYYVPVENGLRRVILFYPRYYQSFAVRLFYFDGQAASPPAFPVYYYQTVSRAGDSYNVLLAYDRFLDLASAQARIQEVEASGKARAVLASEYPDYPVSVVNPVVGIERVYDTKTVKAYKVTR